MKELIRYDSFEELKQEREDKGNALIAVQRHEEMEKLLRVLRKKWMEQKELVKQDTKIRRADERQADNQFTKGL